MKVKHYRANGVCNKNTRESGRPTITTPTADTRQRLNAWLCFVDNVAQVGVLDKGFAQCDCSVELPTKSWAVGGLGVDLHDVNAMGNCRIFVPGRVHAHHRKVILNSKLEWQHKCMKTCFHHCSFTQVSSRMWISLERSSFTKISAPRKGQLSQQ
eukprot:3984014-Amphidinium_carterae.1